MKRFGSDKIMSRRVGFREGFSQFGTVFTILWVVTFIVVFTDSLCSPVIPYILKEFLVEEAAVVAMIGFLSSIFSLVKTVTNFSGALVGDKMDKIMLVFSSLFLSPTYLLLLYLARESLWITGAYIVSGVFFGLIIPFLNAIIADFLPETIRGTSFAIFNLSWILSQIAAPALGGFLSDNIFLRFPIILAFALSLVAVILYSSFLKTLKTKIMPSSKSKKIKADKQEGTEPTRSSTRNLFLLCSVQFFSGLGNGILMPITTAFLMYALGTSPTEMGIAFSIGWGMATALAQIPGGKLSDTLGPKLVILVSVLTATPLLLLLPLSKDVLQFALILGALSFAGNLASPAFSAWIADLIEVKKRGKGYGLTSAANSIGSIIGPAAGSIMWTISKPDYFLPFFVASIPFVFMMPFIIAIKSKSPKTNVS